MSMSTSSTNKNASSEPDESTRLLPDVECRLGGITAPSRSMGPMPLPKAQLGALVAVRLVDPIACTQIF